MMKTNKLNNPHLTKTPLNKKVDELSKKVDDLYKMFQIYVYPDYDILSDLLTFSVSKRDAPKEIVKKMFEYEDFNLFIKFFKIRNLADSVSRVLWFNYSVEKIINFIEKCKSNSFYLSYFKEYFPLSNETFNLTLEKFKLSATPFSSVEGNASQIYAIKIAPYTFNENCMDYSFIRDIFIYEFYKNISDKIYRVYNYFTKTKLELDAIIHGTYFPVARGVSGDSGKKNRRKSKKKGKGLNLKIRI